MSANNFFKLNDFCWSEIILSILDSTEFGKLILIVGTMYPIIFTGHLKYLIFDNFSP